MIASAKAKMEEALNKATKKSIPHIQVHEQLSVIPPKPPVATISKSAYQKAIDSVLKSKIKNSEAPSQIPLGVVQLKKPIVVAESVADNVDED